MNDRYLFKAKTTVKENPNEAYNNIWVKGFLVINDGKYYIHPIANKFSLKGNLGQNVVMHEIDTSTLCQCTGLKDKHGNLIWENDVVKCVFDGTSNIRIVVWDESELDFKGTNGKEFYRTDFNYLGCCEEIEVIGNIFDNPELMEVE